MWMTARQKGSHLILKKPETFYTLSVPDHDELDPGTSRSLTRKAGLTTEEFAALLQ